VKLVDSARMSAIDKRAQAEYGFPSLVLMENAGIAALDLLRRELWGGRLPRGRCVFAAGKGNNGGDAMVMARQFLLAGVRDVAVLLAGGRPAPDSDPGRNLHMCETLGIPLVQYPESPGEARELLCGAEWVFDGLAGTGLSGPLREPLAGAAALIAACGARTVAIDVPSGVGDGFRAGFPAVPAEMTITMGLPKLCLYLPHARSLCGRILVAELGFPPALVQDPSIPGELLEEGRYCRIAPAIPEDAHKNSRGHVAVFAGSSGTTGAAWLAATAAARSRAGLVTLFTDPDAYAVLAPRFSSVMVRSWDPLSRPGEGFDPQRYTAVLAGPGWGFGEGREAWLTYLLGLPVSGVLDADGLGLLARLGRGGQDLGGRWVLTPHPGEFARLAGVEKEAVLDDPVGSALALAGRRGAVVVLKGACTCVAEPGGRYWMYDGMNAALGTGGSGDVLSGIIAGAAASGLPALQAALFGVSLHGRVGRVTRRRRGWFLAEDLLPYISLVQDRRV
jgi:ADP-dependent NAD(P)H-hydrate dehydratase / NAD(P)H-hydrate epimerase